MLKKEGLIAKDKNGFLDPLAEVHLVRQKEKTKHLAAASRGPNTRVERAQPPVPTTDLGSEKRQTAEPDSITPLLPSPEEKAALAAPHARAAGDLLHTG